MSYSAGVFTSHNVQHVLEVCDVAYCLRRGEMVGRVHINDVTDADLVDLITGVRRQAA